MSATPPAHVWDSHAIRAAVHRAGTNLTKLARDAGVYETACREALVRPCPTGERLIAEFLRVPLQELWPDRYAAPSKAESSPTLPRSTSQKPDRIADTRRVA